MMMVMVKVLMMAMLLMMAIVMEMAFVEVEECLVSQSTCTVWWLQ